MKLLNIYLFCVSVFFVSLLTSNKPVIAQLSNHTEAFIVQKDFEPVMSFIENRGQFDGRNWQHAVIEYAVDYNGLNVFFSKKGLTYRFDHFIRNPNRSSQRRHEPKRICYSELASMNWLGANNDVEIIATDEIQPYYSYAFYEKATDEVLNENFIKGYNRLLYKNIYDKIDVEYLSYTQKGIKYNLYLHPGADASQIKMKYEGFHTQNKDENVEFKLTEEGKLLIKGSLFEVSELKPVAFYADNNEEVGISFTFNNGILGFDIENYDNTRLLVIDPWIVSPTLNSSNAVWEVETDNSGNIYIIGGETPMKLNKYNSAGTLQWSYTTPWDTAGYWLGTLATDNAGISYVTAGTSPKIQKISTAGTMMWNNSGPNASCEYWSITFNCDNTKLIVGGTYLPFALSFDFSSVVYDINVSNGAVAGFQTFDTTSVMGGIGVTPVEIRGISASKNAKYNFITHNSVGLITQNIGQCPINVPLYKVPLGYTLGYKCENYLPSTQNGGGLKAIISNNSYVYTHSGNQIHRRDLSTGALIGSVTIPGGQSTTTLGSLVVRNCGLDVDDCGNVYAGSMDRVVKFDQNLNILAQETTGFAVYDVSVNTNGEVLAVGAVQNNSASNRDGKIRSISMGACAQYNPTCCDATICPINPICHNVPAVNLVANSPGGTWSGPGITNPSSGTFDPSVAGPGTHTIVHTLPCGSDSVSIVVLFCATLTPCQELNGDISVSGGTAPYTWQEWVPAGTYPITNQSECTACGYTWQALLSQCMNGMIPVSTCNAPAHWSNFGTGTTITPTANYPLQVIDSQGNAATINSLSSLPACTGCPTLTVTTANTVNISCGGGTGSFDASTTGGSSPYDYVLMQGTTVVATFNDVSGTQSFTGLAAGSYILNVLDNDSCPGSTTITITQTSGPTIGTPVVQDAACGQSNGSITVSPTGGTTPYTYAWDTNPAQTTATATGLVAGSYTVTVTDASSCTATATISVNNIGGPTLQTTSTNASCGQSNGTATVTATGGSGNYTYQWSTSPVQTTATATNLAAGTYSVTVDDGTCIATAVVTIDDVSTGVAVTIINIVADSCSNGVGGATAEVTGGTTPYTYAWSSTPTQTTAILQNVSGGTYTVTVTDGSSCATTASVTISSTPGLNAITNTTNDMCGQGNGTATVIATGGIGVYTYNWSNGDDASTISNLTSGTYSVTISDGTCTTTASAFVATSPGPTASFSSNPSILTPSDGPVTFTDNTAGNIVNWVWDFGDGTPYGSGNQTTHQYQGLGTYVVTLIVTDINGCSDTATGLIKLVDEFTLYIPNAFTPDEDGLNDFFSPVGKNVDPDNFEMYIFDRWGDLMYHTTEWGVTTAKEPWNGTKYNKGTRNDIFVGVYAYRIILKQLDGPKHVYIGSVTLIK